MSLRALGIAASGGRALLRQIDTIAHNLSNVNSIGFHRSRVSFADQAGSGPRLQAIEKLFDSGKLQATQRVRRPRSFPDAPANAGRAR